LKRTDGEGFRQLAVQRWKRCVTNLTLVTPSLLKIQVLPIGGLQQTILFHFRRLCTAAHVEMD